MIGFKRNIPASLLAWFSAIVCASQFTFADSLKFYFGRARRRPEQSGHTSQPATLEAEYLPQASAQVKVITTLLSICRFWLLHINFSRRKKITRLGTSQAALRTGREYAGRPRRSCRRRR